MFACVVGRNLPWISVLTCLLWVSPTAAQAQYTGEQQSAQKRHTQKELKERAEEADQALKILLRNMAVVYRQGQVEFDFGVTYFSDSQANRRVGNGVTPNVETRGVDTTLITSYGLTDRLNVDFTIPYPGYVELDQDARSLGGGRVRQDDVGLGDISTRLTYQLFNEVGPRPAVALDLDIKSDTGSDLLGTGSWNVGGTVRMVKTVDPVVFFGGLGYTKTFEHDGFDPGNEFSYLFGTAFSLNDRVSVSAQTIGTAAGNAEDNIGEIPNTSLDILSLQLGITALVGNNLFIEPVVSDGLTEDATDAVVGIDFIYGLPQYYPLPFLER